MADVNEDADNLAAVAGAVLAAGGPDAYARLVVDRPPAGAAADDLRRRISALSAAVPRESSGGPPADAPGVLAGLWLWHDFLDDSHALSQGLHTPTGSFWHAIMHRREGDFSNAKYWYARCRRHPVLDALPARLADVLGPAERAPAAVGRVLRSGSWDPDAFVDLVQRVHENPTDPLHDVAVRLQRAEWEALFDHCLSPARGGA